MRVIKGNIYCKSDDEIPDDSIVKIYVFDGTDRIQSRTSFSQPAKLLGRTEIPYPNGFPIEYQVEYQERDTENRCLWYYLTVVIEKDNKVLFSNQNVNRSVKRTHSPPSRALIGFEQADSIAKNGKIRRHLDVYLTYHGRDDYD